MTIFFSRTVIQKPPFLASVKFLTPSPPPIHTTDTLNTIAMKRYRAALLAYCNLTPGEVKELALLKKLAFPWISTCH